jgi:hypothetical protein
MKKQTNEQILLTKAIKLMLKLQPTWVIVKTNQHDKRSLVKILESAGGDCIYKK